MNFKELFELWKAAKESELRQTTMCTYTMSWMSIEPFIGGLDIARSEERRLGKEC